MATTIDPTVFVIESPSTQDLAVGRSEGEALSSALRLAQITSHYYRVRSFAELDECLNRIAILTMPKKSNGQDSQITVPHLHFSAHGNADGLALTSGEIIPWEGLRILLVGLGKATGYIGLSGFCLFLVTFSTCEGAHARKMFTSDTPKPCIGIVGPEEPVDWSDSLTAFVTFYHLNLTKHVPAQAAVVAMNQAAGLADVFRCYAHDKMGDPAV